MLHRLFTLCSALSLVLATVAGGTWIRSYFREPDVWVAGYWNYTPHGFYRGYFDAWEVEFTTTPGRCTLRSAKRSCVAGPGRHEQTPAAAGKFLRHGSDGDLSTISRAEHELWGNPAPKGAAGVYFTSQPNARALSVADGEIVALLCLLPIIAMHRKLRRRRSAVLELGSVCGYDLQASPVRCPECGAIPKRSAPANRA